MSRRRIFLNHRAWRTRNHREETSRLITASLTELILSFLRIAILIALHSKRKDAGCKILFWLLHIIRRSWYVVPRSASLIHDDRSTLRLAVEIINNMRTLHDVKISAGLFCNLLKRGSRLHFDFNSSQLFFDNLR